MMINDLDRAQARIRSLQLDIERLRDERDDALRWKEWFCSGKERMQRIAGKVFAVTDQGQELEDSIDALIAEVRHLRRVGQATTSMTGPNLTGPIRRGEFDKQTAKVDIYDADFDTLG